MSAMAGTAIGCVAGHRPPREYAMWLWWSALSSAAPFQQSGNWTCSLRLSRSASGQVGTVSERGVGLFAPQFQNVIRMPCGEDAFAEPAIMRSPGGNALTGSAV